MALLENVKKYIAKAMEWICVVLVFVLTVLTVFAVIMRYVFHRTYIQQEELITFLFVFTVFFATVPVMNAKEHVSIALIENRVPPVPRKIMKIFQYVVIIVVQCLLLYASKKWIETNMNFPTPGLRIPYWTVYISLPLSCALNCVVALIDLIGIVRTPASLFKKEGEE